MNAGIPILKQFRHTTLPYIITSILLAASKLSEIEHNTSLSYKQCSLVIFLSAPANLFYYFHVRFLTHVILLYPMNIEMFGWRMVNRKVTAIILIETFISIFIVFEFRDATATSQSVRHVGCVTVVTNRDGKVKDNSDLVCKWSDLVGGCHYNCKIVELNREFFA